MKKLMFLGWSPDGEVPPTGVIDHPLAPDNEPPSTMDNQLPRDSQNNAFLSNSPSSVGSKPVDTSPSSGQHGSCLSLSDRDRLRIFVHEFVVRGLIPWAERTLRTLNDQVRPLLGVHDLAEIQIKYVTS